ncbi:CPBP family intramembrane metalloprotease [Bosea vestrisii]|uniref:CPBP family intramembrane glutamic endopeptidase n=1 Tax=Bosea vestrisii TaxID=151416 RepID=UPI0024DFAD25|nr:CPBP family intramembrane glutamic endopeptidase [Bosea vestrisii]WID97347.1 CPBP family intramembrane metalloprotease [Bosea vestrisii]
MRESRFAAYVDAARNGKNALWRIVLAIAFIAIVWFAAFLVLLYAGVAIILARKGYWPFGFDEVLEAFDYEALIAEPIGTVVFLLSIASLWIGVWLVLKLIHGRSIRDLFGIDRRLYWPDFARSTIVTLVVGVALGPIALLIDPTVVRGSISLSDWVAAVPLLLVALFLQTSAEEVAFRGYLQQVLAVRFATPIIWLALPAALFTLLHWQADATTAMNLAGLFVVLGVSLSMTWLLMASGNLAAAMGMHFGNNIGVVMLFSHQPELGAAALFTGRSILDPNWTVAQAVMFGLYGVLVVGVTQILLLHRASPVRLRSLP